MASLSGFTFIKNGLTLGYPIKESVLSIAPLCHEIIINVGFNDKELTQDDGTYDYLRSAFASKPKIKFLKSYWDPEMTKGGLILSQQTNIALQACTGDFCFYIQGDEAVHEEDLPAISEGVKRMEEDPTIDGLIFRYIHFYGNVDIIKHTRNIYRREVRLIRNRKGIKSWLDAQGFRLANNEKLSCIPITARVFHYGWARQTMIMNNKVRSFDKLYHGKDFEQKKDFQYERIWGLKPFKGTHPALMSEWIEKHRNSIDIMKMPLRFEWKNFGLAFSDFIESLTGYRIGEYKNFKVKHSCDCECRK